MADVFKALRHLNGAEVEAIKSGQTSVVLTAPNIANKVELVFARDVRVTTGTTPLHLAAQNGHAAVVNTLLEVRGIATEPVNASN
jgi:ankyrin repeat protein